MNDESGMNNIVKKNNKTHIFTPPRPLGSIIKIENNDFFINDMMPTTNYCSNPTEKFLGGSITHIKSPWTLNITSILLNASGDSFWDSKTDLSQSWMVFASRSLCEVVNLGPEIIGLWFTCMKYLNFLMIHTHHMYPSYPIIRWALVSRLSSTHSKMVLRPFSTSNSI